MDKITIQGENLSILVNDEAPVEPPVVEPPINPPVEPPVIEPEPPTEPPNTPPVIDLPTDLARLRVPPDSPPKSSGDVILAPHPRLMITSENKDVIVDKLESPEYKIEKKLLHARNHPENLATRYALYQDVDAGRQALNFLLENKRPNYDTRSHGDTLYSLAFLYTQLRSLMSDEEAKVCRAHGLNFLHQVEHNYANPERIHDGINYTSNVPYDEESANYETVLMLAYHDEEPLAKEAIFSCYSDSKKWFSPYDYGLVATLNALSDDAHMSAHQFGMDGAVSNGYDAMFLYGAAMHFVSWMNATGENLFDKTPFWDNLPRYIAELYVNTNGIDTSICRTLEITLPYINEDAQKLSRWLIANNKTYYALAYRLANGDIRGEQTSPDNLPLQSLNKPGHYAMSRTGYSPLDTAVYLFGRNNDIARNEPDSGMLQVYHNGECVIPGGAFSKGGFKSSWGACPWLFDESLAGFSDAIQLNDMPNGDSRGWMTQSPSNFWRGMDRTTEPPTQIRINDMEQVVNRPEQYLDNVFTNANIEPDFSATVEYARHLYVRAEKVQRQVDHNDNLVTVYDTIRGVSEGVITGLMWRMCHLPTVNRETLFDIDDDGDFDNVMLALEGNVFENEHFIMTVNGPPMRFTWLPELYGPTGHFHSSGKNNKIPGYSNTERINQRMGIGAVWCEPIEQSGNYDFETKIQLK